MAMQTSDYQILANQSPNIGGYRYFFNGQEGDNEVFGEVANLSFCQRLMSSRLLWHNSSASHLPPPT